MTRTHAVVAMAVGIVLPLGSHLLGSGELAYGMYARAEEYRLDVVALDDGSLRHRIAPTALTRGARASVVPLLAGADHWRSAPRIEDLRTTLPSLALHACEARTERLAVAIEVTLEERAREGGAIRTSRAVAVCSP
jgi:hypothetical protein